MSADDRIDDLEWRLRQYHEWLTDSIEQRDRLAIDAAWGVHGALYETVAVLVIFYLYDRFIGWSWTYWYGVLGLGLVVFVVQMLTRIQSNNERMKEVERFAKLPSWDWNTGQD